MEEEVHPVDGANQPPFYQHAELGDDMRRAKRRQTNSYAKHDKDCPWQGSKCALGEHS